MKRLHHLLVCMVFMLIPSFAVASVDSVLTCSVTCPEVKVEIDSLANLNISRASHALFSLNGEWVVAGGHTDGFVPTPTAEYYRNGRWHMMQMVYAHDVGFSVVLKSGRVLLAGGCDQPLGIGQTFLAELYDPKTHSFDGFNCMDQKRTMSTGLELDSGHVVISGNWFHDDGISLFDGKKNFTYLKDVSIQRSMPYIIRIAKDDALIFGGFGIRGDSINGAIADRLKGDTVHIPLFQSWHPLIVNPRNCEDCFIGDESKGRYTYLLPVQDSNGQVAIAQSENGVFSLFPTICPLPMKSQFGPITYKSSVVVDRQAGRAYLLGRDGDFRLHPDQPIRYYVLCIDYVGVSEAKPAQLQLYYTNPLPECLETPILTSEGDLLFVGGILEQSNFKPSKRVYLMRLGSYETAAKSVPLNRWWWIVLTLVLLLIISYLFFRCKTYRTVKPVAVPMETEQPVDADVLLMQRIRQLMEEQKLYLNPELKLSDLATALQTSSRSISVCINSQTGSSFSNFVNIYRVEYAKQLLRHSSQEKMSAVTLACGFSNETSFFRTFKAITGMTPKEWSSKTPS